ncbi:gephyrin-like molybdotransferase Glp [Candidatus Villigracilis affinis]|jgi:molybdopterin molybdotransferase|uniref:molybdopterin molybdotransferase MoeA n=1 Tax=Candidatus Villigracilis affinis TaxID=3140682 RepID=UPI001D6486E5|nr:molybdopterin molybdotransferase MoeA [Anaerolineales bacterium]MBL0344657.1 molybdopterin molybdotransferase MoeA [Anaerolineales bacterium]
MPWLLAMYSVTEARERILSHFQSTPQESIPLIECANRVLAADISAAHDLPPFDNSSMDGFAIRSADSANAAAQGVTLKVVADIPAGSVPTVTLTAGEAARIMTGAQLPKGADAVIPVEDTDFHVRDAGTVAPQTVSFSRIVKAGENVRPRGMDLLAGDVVLQKGRRLKPQDLGLLAMLGFAKVAVHKKPRVALLSSGDELLEVDAPLTEGKIHDSNSYALAAAIQNAGVEVIRLGVAKDTRESVEGLLKKAIAENVDLIVSSAGVSVGAFDFVKEVIESNGRLDFWRVNMRPGKPLAFGEYGGRPFIGLPGNPVSAFVGFEVFVRPVLEKLGGQLDGGRLTVRARCEEVIESDGRESYLRARIRTENGIHTAVLTGHQGSGNLLSLVQADALLIIPAGVKCVPVGQEVEAIIL